MATLFGMYPFLQKLFADAGYQGPEFATALAKVRPHLSVEIVKRSDRSQRICCPAQTLDRRTHACLAQSLSQARQGLGEPQSKGAGVLAPRLVPFCVTSAWHQNTNSRNASWPASPTSIAIQSSTPGPISSLRLPDMIRTMETLT